MPMIRATATRSWVLVRWWRFPDGCAVLGHPARQREEVCHMPVPVRAESGGRVDQSPQSHPQPGQFTPRLATGFRSSSIHPVSSSTIC